MDGPVLAVGEMFTLAADGVAHAPRNPGGWHCRVTGAVFGDGLVSVQEMKIDGSRWRPAMRTTVLVSALRPLAVQTDLFGDPEHERTMTRAHL